MQTLRRTVCSPDLPRDRVPGSRLRADGHAYGSHRPAARRRGRSSPEPLATGQGNDGEASHATARLPRGTQDHGDSSPNCMGRVAACFSPVNEDPPKRLEEQSERRGP